MASEAEKEEMKEEFHDIEDQGQDEHEEREEGQDEKQKDSRNGLCDVQTLLS